MDSVAVQVPVESLQTFIDQVRLEEKQGRVKKSTLLGLVTRYLSVKPCSRQEEVEASIIAAKYSLTKLLNRRKRLSCYRLIEEEQAKPYFYRCCICGRPLSNTKSLERGMGKICCGKYLLQRKEETKRIRLKLEGIAEAGNRHVATIQGPQRLAPTPGGLPR